MRLEVFIFVFRKFYCYDIGGLHGEVGGISMYLEAIMILEDYMVRLEVYLCI